MTTQTNTLPTTTQDETPKDPISYHQGRREKNPGSTEDFAIMEAARRQSEYDQRKAAAEGLAGQSVVRNQAQIVQAVETQQPALHHERPH